MHGRIRLKLLLMGFAVCVALIGCANSRARSNAQASRPPKSADPLEKAPDLRISAELEPDGPTIPLVPIQPPPLYKNDKDRVATKDSKARTEKSASVAPVAAGPAVLPGAPVAPVASGATGAPVLAQVPAPTPMAEPPPQPVLGTLPIQAPIVAALTAPMTAGISTLPVDKVIEQSRSRYAGLDSYVARFTRREAIGGKIEPEELILFKFRKAPFSVYFKWLGNVAQGREVIYVQGQHESKIHSLLAAGDIPLMPAGKRMALSPDNILVQSATRHPITEAGLGATLDRLMQTQTALSRGDGSKGQLVDRGMQNRADYEGGPLRLIEHTLPPGLEKPLPRGGKRLVGFDTHNHLPVLIQTYDDKGQEVEYYRYDRLLPAVSLDDHDFHPEFLWRKPDTNKRMP